MKYTSTLLAVTDMEKSKQFYHDVLGLDIVADFGANVTIKLAAEMSVCDTFEKKLMDTFAGNVVLNDKENVKFCRNMAGNIIFL